MAISTYLQQKILEHVYKNTTYTPPTTVYVALYTTNPGYNDTGTEVSGGAYVRQSITFGVFDQDVDDRGYLPSTNDPLEFPEATDDWGTITHVGLRDSLSGGNLLHFGALSSEVVINTNDQLMFNSGELKAYLV